MGIMGLLYNWSCNNNNNNNKTLLRNGNHADDTIT
jgi:hypothetical protein